jgi:hypothetical protein
VKAGAAVDAPSDLDLEERRRLEFFFALRRRYDDPELLEEELLLLLDEELDEELLLLLLVLGLRGRLFFLDPLFSFCFEALDGSPGAEEEAEATAGSGLLLLLVPWAAVGGLGDRAHTSTATPTSKRHRARQS